MKTVLVHSDNWRGSLQQEGQAGRNDHEEKDQGFHCCQGLSTVFLSVVHVQRDERGDRLDLDLIYQESLRGTLCERQKTWKQFVNVLGCINEPRFCIIDFEDGDIKKRMLVFW